MASQTYTVVVDFGHTSVVAHDVPAVLEWSGESIEDWPEDGHHKLDIVFRNGLRAMNRAGLGITDAMVNKAERWSVIPTR